MKRLRLLAPLLFVISCQSIDPITRFDHNSHLGSRSDETISEAPIYESKYYTTLYFCAVEFNSDYDWVQDSAYGAVDYNLHLYRDYKKILTIPSSSELISHDADTHHIVDSHLYTEKTIYGKTVISCDGEELFSFEGREFLKGIVPCGTETYTLSKRRSGNGFSFRCDGKILFESPDGELFGSLCDPSYGNTGALYIDEGKLCFCYYCENRAYSVIDGVETALPFGYYQDIKVIKGEVITLNSPFNGNYISEARLWRTKEIAVSAFFDYAQTPYSGIYNRYDSSSYNKVCNGEANLYVSDDAFAGVYSDASNKTFIFGNPLWEQSFNGLYYFMSPKCAQLYGDHFYIGLSPYLSTGKAVVIDNDKIYSVDINGFISDVAIELSPP